MELNLETEVAALRELVTTLEEKLVVVDDYQDKADENSEDYASYSEMSVNLNDALEYLNDAIFSLEEYC